MNNVRVVGATRLRLGDRLQVGSTILVFTQHDELESRMLQQQRLSAMSTLTAGLAHDFNNALMVIASNVDVVGESLPPGASDALEALEDMRRAIVAASDLAKRLILDRSPPIEVEPVPVTALVDETLGMTRHLLGRTIAISTSFDPGVGVGGGVGVRGSRDELRQVLVNFLINARDAMPHGGKLIIAVRIVHFDRINALSRHLPAEGAYVEVAITDTGIGMDEATRARVFEPFFTTKLGKGTGLGLAMAHKIVFRHGGAILVESVRDHGTTFRTLLPLAS